MADADLPRFFCVAYYAEKVDFVNVLLLSMVAVSPELAAVRCLLQSACRFLCMRSHLRPFPRRFKQPYPIQYITVAGFSWHTPWHSHAQNTSEQPSHAQLWPFSIMHLYIQYPNVKSFPALQLLWNCKFICLWAVIISVLFGRRGGSVSTSSSQRTPSTAPTTSARTSCASECTHRCVPLPRMTASPTSSEWWGWVTAAEFPSAPTPSPASPSRSSDSSPIRLDANQTQRTLKAAKLETSWWHTFFATAC